jgi:hypothetical protein
MSITGELITETFEYDGGREVTVYVPPQPPEAVVFAGDGQLISQWVDRAAPVARRRVLASRVRPDGGVGVWTVSIATFAMDLKRAGHGFGPDVAGGA